jgi:hypothetical protein
VLEPVYEWPLVVARDPAVGAPALIPLRRTAAGRSPGRGADPNDPLHGST